MEIILNRNADELEVVLKGKLDSTTAPELEKALNESLEGIKNLYLEFKDLSYLSSAGLRILLSTQKRMNKQGKMVLRHVNDLIMETLDMTGFSNILTFEE